MVKWSRPARMDLKQIHDYIAKDSKYYAKKVVQTIIEKTEELIDFPITPNGIEVLAVIHGRRDFFERITET